MTTRRAPRPADLSGLRSLLAEGQARARREDRPVFVSLTRPLREPPEASTVFTAAHRLGLARSFWAHPAAKFWMVGIGMAYEASAHNGEFATVKEAHRRLIASALIEDSGGPGPVLLGSFRFDSGMSPDADWEPFAAGSLTLPRWMVTFQEGQGWLTVNVVVAARDNCDDIATALTKESCRLDHTDGVPQQPPSARVIEADDRRRWEQAVGTALADIHAARLSKVTLARSLTVESEEPLVPELVLQRLLADYPECRVFALERGGACFLGATPEELVKLRQDRVSSTCLAGSVRRGGSPEEDAALAQRMLNSDKERREHGLVVDWVLERMRPLCTDLHWDGPRITQLSNVQHLATAAVGTPRPGTHVLDFVAALHPTPAVAGVPAGLALETIRRLEERDRGWYAGPVGWVDQHGDGYFGLALRCALLNGNHAVLYAGAGIVNGSEPEQEYLETEMKLRPLLSALGAL